MAALRHHAPSFGVCIDAARKSLKASQREFRRIQRQLSGIPRHTPGVITVFGRPTRYVDAASFTQMYRDAFVDCSNDFSSSCPAPVILDCGSNIGLTILRFKQLYPDSLITAFEPDPKIFECLRCNIASWGLKNIELVQAAIWINNDGIKFSVDGSTGGRVDESNGLRVRSVRLKELLAKHVDFLKLDIEGAEAEVISDCGDCLANVDALIIEWHMREGYPQRLGHALDVLAAAQHRYFVHHCWPVEVRRPWQWSQGAMQQILAIHSRVLSEHLEGASEAR